MPPRPGAFRGSLPHKGTPAPPWPPGYDSVLMEGPALPRPPLLPLTPARHFRCRYHPQTRGTAGINRGWGADGWVMVCQACELAIRSRQLQVLSPEGGYVGRIPQIGVARCADEPLGEDTDLFE